MPKKGWKKLEENQEDKSGRTGKAKGGRPRKQLVEYIDIEKLPTRFQSAEEFRGYLLQLTDGGRVLMENLVRDYKSHKTSKTVRLQIAKLLIELMTPAKGQTFEVGMQSPDGQFVFRWQNEVLPDA